MATNPWAAEIARTNSAIQQTQSNIARDQALLAANPNGPDAARLRLQIDSGQEYLVELQAQLAIFTREYNDYDKDSTASSGQVIKEEAQAKVSGAAASNPVASVTVTGITDEELAARQIETGTNGRVRPLQETQATPPAPQTNVNDDRATASAPQNAGVGAPSEDGTVPNATQAQRLVNATFNQPIRPQGNILDQYASYSYALSWYLLTPRQYTELMGAGNRNTATWQLLMQSGGAPTQVGDATAGGRNQYFSLDFYMDNLEIDTLCTLKGTGTAHSATALRFNVTEPSGLTLIPNLYDAVRNLYNRQTDGSVPTNFNYAMAMHCMVIRFYGYNENGEIVKVGRRGASGNTNVSDPTAVVEKYYPFVVTNITFRNANRAIEYRVEGVPQGYNYGFGVNRGTIPYNFELAGRTVKDILSGPSVAAPPTDSNRPTTVQPATTQVPGPPDPGYAVDPNGVGLF